MSANNNNNNIGVNSVKRIDETLLEIDENNDENYLGRGSNGFVIKGKYLGTDIAAKGFYSLHHPRTYGIQNAQQERTHSENMGNEFKLLATLQHPNLLQLIGVGYFPPPRNNTLKWIITELADTSLQHIIEERNQRNERLSEKEIIMFSIEILKGLSYLHENNGVHRDLKPPNILLFHNNSRLKIADLGEAKIFQSNPAISKHTFKGTPLYVAPEVYTAMYNEKVDIYSFGVMLTEMILGEIPPLLHNDAAQNHRDRLVQMERAIRVMEAVFNTPKKQSFIISLINIDPSKRPSALASLAFFQSLLPPDNNNNAGNNNSNLEGVVRDLFSQLTLTFNQQITTVNDQISAIRLEMNQQITTLTQQIGTVRDQVIQQSQQIGAIDQRVGTITQQIDQQSQESISQQFGDIGNQIGDVRNMVELIAKCKICKGTRQYHTRWVPHDGDYYCRKCWDNRRKTVLKSDWLARKEGCEGCTECPDCK